MDLEKVYYVIAFVVVLGMVLFTFKRCNDCQNVGGTWTRSGCFKQEIKDY